MEVPSCTCPTDAASSKPSNPVYAKPSSASNCSCCCLDCAIGLADTGRRGFRVPAQGDDVDVGKVLPAGLVTAGAAAGRVLQGSPDLPKKGDGAVPEKTGDGAVPEKKGDGAVPEATELRGGVSLEPNVDTCVPGTAPAEYPAEVEVPWLLPKAAAGSRGYAPGPCIICYCPFPKPEAV